LEAAFEAGLAQSYDGGGLDALLAFDPGIG